MSGTENGSLARDWIYQAATAERNEKHGVGGLESAGNGRDAQKKTTDQLCQTPIDGDRMDWQARRNQDQEERRGGEDEEAWDDEDGLLPARGEGRSRRGQATKIGQPHFLPGSLSVTAAWALQMQPISAGFVLGESRGVCRGSGGKSSTTGWFAVGNTHQHRPSTAPKHFTRCGNHRSARDASPVDCCLGGKCGA